MTTRKCAVSVLAKYPVKEGEYTVMSLGFFDAASSGEAEAKARKAFLEKWGQQRGLEITGVLVEPVPGDRRSKA